MESLIQSCDDLQCDIEFVKAQANGGSTERKDESFMDCVEEFNREVHVGDKKSDLVGAFDGSSRSPMP